MLIVTEYHNFDELDTVRDTWNRLWQQTPDASFQQSYDAFKATCKLSPYRDELKVLMISLMGKPIGFVPLVVRPLVSSVGTMRCLTFPLQEWHSFYHTIGPHKTIILQTAIKHLKKANRDWDYLDWTGLMQQGREKERLETAGKLHGIKVTEHAGREISTVNLEKGWYAYWTEANAEFRQAAHAMERRLKSMGSIRFMRCRSIATEQDDEAENNLVFQHLEEIQTENLSRHIDGHQERRGVKVWNFIKQTHHSAVANAVADWSVMYVNDEPVAAAYGLAHQGKLELLSVQTRIGWPKDSRLVLMKSLIEDSCRRGDLEIVLPTSWNELAKKVRTDSVATCRYVHTPLKAWKVRAWKTTRSFSELIGKPSRPIGFYDEVWKERRKSNLTTIQPVEVTS